VQSNFRRRLWVRADAPSGTQHYHHGQIGHEQRCVDDEDPEHRSPQHRPIGNPDAPSTHQDRQIIGKLAEVTRGEKHEQRDLRFNRLEEVAIAYAFALQAVGLA